MRVRILAARFATSRHPPRQEPKTHWSGSIPRSRREYLPPEHGRRRGSDPHSRRLPISNRSIASICVYLRHLRTDLARQS